MKHCINRPPQPAIESITLTLTPSEFLTVLRAVGKVDVHLVRSPVGKEKPQHGYDADRASAVYDSLLGVGNDAGLTSPGCY